MDDKLVNWTHWYEEFPAYAMKCIIVEKGRDVFWRTRIKIFTDGGYTEWVKPDRLIAIK